MRHLIRHVIGCAMSALPLIAVAGTPEKYFNDFSDTRQLLNTVGRGLSEVNGAVYKSKDSYSTFGDRNLKDYEYSFKARSVKSDQPVQIWSGISFSFIEKKLVRAISNIIFAVVFGIILQI